MMGYPRWFTKKLIHTIFLLSLVTGALLFPTVLILKLEWDFPWRLPTEQRDWIVIAHVVMGFVVFTLLGALSSIHMRLGFRKKSKRASGVALVLFILFLAGSGIGVLYSGDEGTSTAVSLVHFILGVSMGILYILHLLQKPNVASKLK